MAYRVGTHTYKELCMNFGVRSCFTCVGLLFFSVHGRAQDAELLTGNSESLETRIVDRDWALRLRIEESVTDDREGLLRDDPAYRAVPNEILAFELRAIAAGSTITASSEQWDTRQDLGSDRRSLAVSIPFVGSWYGRMRLTHWDQENAVNRYYQYYGVGGFLYRGLFIYSEYSHDTAKGYPANHGYSQYVSGSLHPRLRLGGSVAGRSNLDDRSTWSGSWFVTFLAYPEWTTIRVDGAVGGGQDVDDYNQTTLVCYQRISERLVLKPMFRYYTDDADRESQAYGLTLLAYLTSALDVQGGYRYYSQNEGGDFDTFTFGLSLVF